MRQGDFFTVMSDRHTAALTLALYDREDTVLKDLQSVTKHPQTLRQRLDQMEEEGIVNLETVYTTHKFVKISLTETGKEIALLLSMADTVIPGDIADKSINMRYADPILRVLRGKEYVIQKDIKAVMPYYNSFTRVLSQMEKEGLVDIGESTESYREVRYSLTPTGKRIADVFDSIYRKIDSVRKS